MFVPWLVAFKFYDMICNIRTHSCKNNWAAHPSLVFDWWNGPFFAPIKGVWRWSSWYCFWGECFVIKRYSAPYVYLFLEIEIKRVRWNDMNFHNERCHAIFKLLVFAAKYRVNLYLYSILLRYVATSIECSIQIYFLCDIWKYDDRFEMFEMLSFFWNEKILLGSVLFVFARLNRLN